MSRKVKELGFLLDCSGNAIYSVDTLKTLIDYLVSWGYTYLMLGISDTYSIDKEPYFGYLRGAYSAKELKEVDDYAFSKGLELRAGIQLLGHLEKIAKYNDYNLLFENSSVLRVGDDRVYQLVDKMLLTISQSFRSKNIHIGMDECYWIGRSEKFIKQNGLMSQSDIVARHLERVLQIAEKYEYKCKIWSDMLLGDAKYNGEKFAQSFKNVEVMYWFYDAAPKEVWDKDLSSLKRITPNVGFVGSAMSYFGFVPMNEYSINTMRKQLDACERNGVEHFLVSRWNDSGGEASIFSLLPAIYSVGMMAQGIEYNKMDKKLFYQETGLDYWEFLECTDIANIPDKEVFEYRVRNNKSFMFLYQDLLSGLFDVFVRDNISHWYASAANKLKKLSESKKYGYVFATLEALCRVLEIKSEWGVKIKRAYDDKNLKHMQYLADDLVVLRQRIDVLYNAFFEQWQKDCKSQGWEIQCIRLGGLTKRAECVERYIRDFVDGKTNVIEELEAAKLYLDYPNGGLPVDVDNCIYGNYSAVASVNRF